MVVLAVVLLPVFELGFVVSNGEAVLAPLTAKATALESSAPVREIVIVIEPLADFKAQKVCRVLELDIATFPRCVQDKPPPETLAV